MKSRRGNENTATGLEGKGRRGEGKREKGREGKGREGEEFEKKKSAYIIRKENVGERRVNEGGTIPKGMTEVKLRGSE